MALLGAKKPMAKPSEVVTEPPLPKPGDDPPPAPVEVTSLAPPARGKQVALVMGTDGGLNGQCWRAGEVVILDADAADFYLAKGYATRVK